MYKRQGQTVAVVIRVADPQTFVVREVLRRTFLNVGIEDAREIIRVVRIIRERCNRAVSPVSYTHLSEKEVFFTAFFAI